MQLDAFLDDLTIMPDACLLTQTQLDGMLRDVLTRHLEKLERVAAAAKLSRHFDHAAAERDDRWVAWVYRLLEAKGPQARVSPADREAILADGLSETEVAHISAHLDRLREGGSVPTKAHLLRPLLEAQNAEPTAMNLAQAQQVYFLGMRLALERTEARYRGVRGDSDTLVDGIIRLNAEQRLAAMTAAGKPGREAMDPVAANVEPAKSTIAQQETRPSPSTNERRVTTLGGSLERKRVKERSWDAKTASQASRLFALFERFLAEECGLEDLSALRQSHLAKFVNFLQFEIYKHYGKSAADVQRTIAELRAVAASKNQESRGIEAPTLNRHLTFLNQLFEHARAEGLELDPNVQTARLRGRTNKDDRARNARPTLKVEAATRVFAQPPFTGCKSWREPLLEGPEIFHRALYFVPLLLYYSGARREEICGLSPDDLIVDNGAIPYIHIAPNAVRRLKNAQSRRNCPLHPELIRLGFLDYVKAIKALGYERLFPDLHSPTSKSPLGDRFYDEFKPVLTAADTDETGFVIHSVRRGFGNALKQKRVTEEERGDLLGHVGKTETSERYCDAFEIETLNKLISAVPIVTERLTHQPIRLLPWVEAHEVAPFSRASRAAGKRSKEGGRSKSRRGRRSTK